MPRYISDPDRPKQASFIKIRLVVAILVVLCPVVCYISRQNLSLALTAMIDKTDDGIPLNLNKHKANSSSSLQTNSTSLSLSGRINNVNIKENSVDPDDICPVPIGDEVLKPTYGPKYKWKNYNILFETFFIAYVVCQIPAGRMAETLGPSLIFMVATAGSSVLSAFIPLAATIHMYLFALIRGLMGICQAAMYPACYALFSQWLPPQERAYAIPMIMAGSFIGSIITSTATGYFSEQKSFGWEYSFYFASICCGLWALAWFFLGSDEPRQHRLISLEEINYIESQLEIKRIQSNGKAMEKLEPSWWKLLKSPAIWSMNASFFASDWAFSITLLVLPEYLSNIHHLTPLKNGLINSIIYVLFIITAPIYGLLSTFMIERKLFGLTCLTYRKIYQSIALFSQTICLLLIVYFGCDTYLVLATLYIQVILYSFNNIGEVLIPSDLSPHFSGTIYAIANTVGSSTGFIIPRVQSILVENTQSRSNWALFFYLSSGITLVGGIIFALFGTNKYHDFSKDSSDHCQHHHHYQHNSDLHDLKEQGKTIGVFNISSYGSHSIDKYSKPVSATLTSKPKIDSSSFITSGSGGRGEEQMNNGTYSRTNSNSFKQTNKINSPDDKVINI